ncbi:MAG TPA: metal ABC transporter solute-binding protein [Xanthobacteraceae bacterium]|nr:metal ABC transporter solute-binding protein [Xanthobacteraceae bacterium]
MKIVVGCLAALFVAWGGIPPAHSTVDKIAIVAAENFYGDVAQQVGGNRVSVTSILHNPDQDPHLFETSPSSVRELVAARVVIYNGADYDPWMEKLLEATSKPGRIAIIVADLMRKKAGDNPHLWYDPMTMPAVANALANSLSAIDPAHADDYATRAKTFIASLRPLNNKIAGIRTMYNGQPVTATEPVFGYMAAALHLTMLNQRFQLAIMNNTEPSARDIAAFEEDIEKRKVRVLFFNKQTSDTLVRYLIDLAHASKIPVVGVTETCPAGKSYQDWMLDELDQTENALAGPAS